MGHQSYISPKKTIKMEKVKQGDRIRITKLDDPYTPESYVGKEGTVEYIDDAGQLHGSWGGLAVIPGVDDFIII